MSSANRRIGDALLNRAPASRAEQVTHALRERICLAPAGPELVLHEEALAKEFGVSRTPIRQCLQRLAYEKLVETRSGVGTIAVALNEADREVHFLTHRGLVRAVLGCEPLDLSAKERAEIKSIALEADDLPSRSAPQFYDMRARLTQTFCNVIPDPLLLDAYLASSWRILRWQIRDFAEDPVGADRQFNTLIRAIVDELDNGAAAIGEAMERIDLVR